MEVALKAVLVALSAATAHALTAPDPNPLVDIPSLGNVTGIFSTEHHSVRQFYNLPFAEPPIDNLRWSRPVPRTAWGPNSTLNGTFPGNACIQPSNMWGQFDPNDLSRPYLGLNMSEDCLNLNVHTPVAARSLPVAVWFHGGGYSIGAGAHYPGDSLVAASNNSIVVVTINYRLGVFGFLGSAELAARDKSNSTGNYGIEDQRLALRWVQKYISAFGGDPRRVTIFGESAGGSSVLTHLTQAHSYTGAGEGLYHRAIIQSGTYDGATPFSAAESTYEALLNGTNCKNLSCLMLQDAHSLAAAFPATPVSPVIDGVAQLDLQQNLIHGGRYNKNVPVMLGHNREENAVSMVPYTKVFSESNFDAMFNSTYNETQIREMKLLYSERNMTYPQKRGNMSNWWWAAAAAASDEEWGLGHCSVRRVARDLAAGGTVSVHVYIFEHPPQRDALDGTFGWRLENGGISMQGNVVCSHATEIVYAFGDAGAVERGEEAVLATSMGSLWSSFVTSGTLKGWPAFSTAHAESTGMVLVLDVNSSGGIRPAHNYRKLQCDFWDKQLVAPPGPTPSPQGGSGPISDLGLGAILIGVLVVVGGVLARWNESGKPRRLADTNDSDSDPPDVQLLIPASPVHE